MRRTEPAQARGSRAEILAAEREQCFKDVCSFCAGLESEWPPNSAPERRKIRSSKALEWYHEGFHGEWLYCRASPIRARITEESRARQ